MPLNSSERAERLGSVPYWGANGVVDYVDEPLLDEPLVLLGEDGAPFFDSAKDVAFASNGPIWPNNHIHVLRVRPHGDLRFVTYALNAFDYGAVISGSTRDKLTQEDMMSILLPLPHIDEQRAIADFLDRETARIDALIAAKRRMIKLMEEIRRTFIAKATTMGLSDDPELHATGNEFAPFIPAGWRMVRLKNVVHGVVDTAHKTAPEVPEGDYLVVRTANVKSGHLVFTDAKYTDEAGFREWTERAVPRPGDIMFTREAPAGEACLVPEGVPLCIGQRMVLIRTDSERMLPEYGLHSLYGGPAQEFIRLLSRSTTVAHLNMADIPSIPIALPPPEEQSSIVAAIAVETARLDRLGSTLVRQIELLAEHRQALIAAAVSGDIDVQGVAA